MCGSNTPPFVSHQCPPTSPTQALMVSLYLAMWPIGTGGTENAATNPLVDLHWVLTLSAILFALTRAGDTLGLGAWWSRLVGDSWLR